MQIHPVTNAHHHMMIFMYSIATCHAIQDG